MSISLENKVVLITGSTRGIGLSIAQTLAEHGANIIISGRSQVKCDEIAIEIPKRENQKIIGISCDVSDPISVKQLIEKTLQTFSKIDVLVNNAGITKDNLMLRLSEDDFNDVIKVNLNSVFYTSKGVLRTMLKQKTGKIINISSVVGIIGNAGQTNYAASKAGIFGLTKSIAKEVGKKGITCNAIAPGFIETDMIETLPKEHIDNIIQTIPLARLGKSKDIANIVLFLASDLSNYITGEIFTVDGGIQL
jgi:3-oxoacyl-[acyl-carrier protein] reductase